MTWNWSAPFACDEEGWPVGPVVWRPLDEDWDKLKHANLEMGGSHWKSESPHGPHEVWEVTCWEGSAPSAEGHKDASVTYVVGPRYMAVPRGMVSRMGYTVPPK